MNSCTHPECARVQNMAASLSDIDGELTAVDLSRLRPDRRAWFLECACADDISRSLRPSATTYMRDNRTGDWFRVQVSQVTDQDVITQLETAATGSAPSLADLGMPEDRAARIDDFLDDQASGVRRSRPGRE